MNAAAATPADEKQDASGPLSARQRRIAYCMFSIALLACIPLQTCRGIQENSVTVDEFAHMPAGLHYWKTGDFRPYNENPPLAKLIATLPWLFSQPKFDAGWYDETLRMESPGWEPWLLGDMFMRANAARYGEFFAQCRWTNVVVTIAVGLLVLIWSRQLFGPAGGLISLSAFAFCPTVLAHGSLATTDVAGMGTFALALYGTGRYAEKPSWRTLLLVGAAVGAALVTKFSALLLGLIIPLALLTRLGFRIAAAEEDEPAWPIYRPFVVAFSGIPLIAWLAVLAGYGFRDVRLHPLATDLQSSAMRSARSLAGWLPTPLPAEFVHGIDNQQFDLEHGEASHFYFLNGSVSRTGWWYYFPAAFVIKEPVLLALLLFIAVLSLWRPPDITLREKVFLLLPICAFLACLLLFVRLDIGVRYLLPIYPLLFVLAGRVALTLKRLKDRRVFNGVIAVVILGQVIPTLSTAGPDYIGHFNEFIPADERRAHLLDSNLDWGQDLRRLASYCAEHDKKPIYLAYFGHVDPALYGIEWMRPPDHPQPGTFVVSANFLAGMDYAFTYTHPPEEFSAQSVAWLRGQKPAATIGSSLLVFEVLP